MQNQKYWCRAITNKNKPCGQIAKTKWGTCNRKEHIAQFKDIEDPCTEEEITYCNVITRSGKRCTSKATSIWGTCQRNGHLPHWVYVDEYKNPNFIGYEGLSFPKKDWIILLLIKKSLNLPKFVFWKILSYHLSDYQKVRVGSIISWQYYNISNKTIVTKVLKYGWEIDVAYPGSGTINDFKLMFELINKGEIQFDALPFKKFTWRPEIQKYVRHSNSSIGHYAKSETLCIE